MHKHILLLKSCHNDDRDIALFPNFLDYIGPVQCGHVQVSDDQIHPARPEFRQTLLSGVGSSTQVPVTLKSLADTSRKGIVIVNDENGVLSVFFHVVFPCPGQWCLLSSHEGVARGKQKRISSGKMWKREVGVIIGTIATLR